jgi:modulator of FtsH protease
MSYSAYNPEGVALNPAANVALDERVAFIRKVYLMTLSGILMFFAVAGGLTFGAVAGIEPAATIVNAMLSINPLIYFLGFLGLSIAAHKLAFVPGINVVAYYTFAAALGLLTTPLMLFALVKAGGTLDIIFQAFALTTLTFGGLTAYVFISKKDFSFLGGFLAVGMIMAVAATFLLIIATMVFNVDVDMMSAALSIFATLLFIGYILYDTSNVLHKYATDMVVPASMALMVDFVMLFRLILSLLSRR